MCTMLLQNSYIKEAQCLWSPLLQSTLSSFKYPQPLYIFLPALKLSSHFAYPKQLLGQAPFQNCVSILPQRGLRAQYIHARK